MASLEIPEAKSQLVHQPMIDSSKVLSDLFHDLTENRRNLILGTFPVSIKSTLEKTSADAYLFGKDIKSAIQAAKDLEKVSKDLKKTPVKGTLRKDTTTSKKDKQGKSSLNFRGPSRNQPYSKRRGGQYSRNPPRQHK